MIVLLVYVAIFVVAFLAVHLVRSRRKPHDLTSRKTVTFGDESAVTADRAASVVSVIAIFLIWGAFTGSHLVPFHVPGPFTGTTSFTYTLKNEQGATAQGNVEVLVYPVGHEPDLPEPEQAAGFAPDVVTKVAAWRSALIRTHAPEGTTIVAVNGHPVEPDQSFRVDHGTLQVTKTGAFVFIPDTGMQIEPIWLPAPEAVVSRLIQIASEGYRNVALWDHVGSSLMRVVLGMIAGAVVGIPLGYAMGLSSWFRGWFDPIVEFMRPVPPLALIPLVIIWFGIWETGKTVLLFLAALWIMVIAARAGVSGVNITKIHAAYSLGASKWQILLHVIIPNSLPEIFTGARVAMGVCWGTVVAAELVAAEKGVGMMIMVASKFQLTDIVVMGIILIGVIGYSIDILMRAAERYFVPWKGRS